MKPHKETWHTLIQYIMYVRRPRSKLRLVVQYSTVDYLHWHALAIESDQDGPGVLESHSHELIGEYTSEQECKDACETYARKWRSKKKDRTKCACDTIKIKP